MRLDGSSPADVEAAARLLAAGRLVAFPTETVYGLGARADDGVAVDAIYRTKGRPSGHPLIVHLAETHGIGAFAVAVPPFAGRLIDAFWPGPLTLILLRRPGVAETAAAGQPTIGLRVPSHPVARALLAAAQRLGVPGVAAPSANRFGRVSPTRAAHVADEFGPALTVLDGGPAEVGIESCIVDASRERPVLLRPGVLTADQLAAAAGLPIEAADAGAPRAPGTLAAHYAPAATLRLLSTDALRAALQTLPAGTHGLAVYSRGAVPVTAAGVLHRRMADSAAGVAQELFAVLRGFDAAGASTIWVEAPASGLAWDGVRDRLGRAAAR